MFPADQPRIGGGRAGRLECGERHRRHRSGRGRFELGELHPSEVPSPDQYVDQQSGLTEIYLSDIESTCLCVGAGTDSLMGWCWRPAAAPATALLCGLAARMRPGRMPIRWSMLQIRTEPCTTIGRGATFGTTVSAIPLSRACVHSVPSSTMTADRRGAWWLQRAMQRSCRMRRAAR